MGVQGKKQTTSTNRDEVVIALAEHLEADGMPGELVELFKVLGDMCYGSFIAGKMVAQRMVLEGDIKADQVFKTAMEFARIIAMKISLAPQPSQLMRPQNIPTVSVPGLGDMKVRG